MIKPLTALQENAAKLFVEGNTQIDAYRKAGYKVDTMSQATIQTEATRLFATPTVSLRVQELQEKAQQRHNVTLDSLTKEYDEAKAFAYNLEQVSSAVSAINGKAKIHGFDKSVIDLRVKKIVKVIDMSGKE